MVKGKPIKISCRFKVKFYVKKKKYFHGVLAWSDYWTDKYNLWIANEMDMTPLQVSCRRGKFLPHAQSGTPTSTHDGAVSVRDLAVMLLCWVKSSLSDMRVGTNKITWNFTNDTRDVELRDIHEKRQGFHQISSILSVAIIMPDCVTPYVISQRGYTLLLCLFW